MEDSNNNDSLLSIESFNKVWRNIVLFRCIFKHVRLYEENEYKLFGSRKELLEYQYREYVGSIRYKGEEMLEIGDLPNGCVLKKLSPTPIIVNGDVIPFGVTSIRFVGDGKTLPKMTNLSKYPSSVTFIFGAYVGARDSNIGDDDNGGGCIMVPESITSLQTRGCTNVSGVDKGNGYIVFSNTIKSIYLNRYWDNDGIILRKGDFPEGLKKLTAPGYQIKNLSEGVLPSTLEHLELLYGKYYYSDDEGYFEGINDDINKEPGYFNVIPPNVSTFDINCHCDILESSKFNTCTSIKKLFISFLGSELIVEPNALPPNITHLVIDKLDVTIKKGVIPNSVTNLKIEYYLEGVFDGFTFFQDDSIPSSVLTLTLNTIITQPNILPNSLTELVYQQIGSDKDFTTDQFNQMISVLPPSLQSICLPVSFKDKFTFPNTINKIEFDNYKY